LSRWEKQLKFATNEMRIKEEATISKQKGWLNNA
jgi:hypothetical protein